MPVATRGGWLFLGAALALAVTRPGLADRTIYVPQGAAWRYLRGLEEASTPPGAWRARGFDDSGWARGPAPVGYGEPRIATDLSLQSPPMRGNYSSVFLRAEFALSDPSRLAVLEVDVDYDDGLILWVNGTEVLRANMPSGEMPFDGFATGNHESGEIESYRLPDPAGYLVAGTNVLAAQVFQNQINSSDLYFDLELFDPLGPDLTPAQAVSIAPAPGATVRSLTRIEVRFSEPVQGVDASDLQVAGAGASAVSGSGGGPYVFSFPGPPPGPVAVSWVAAHGIGDLADPPNGFAGGSWSYTVDPDAPPADLAISEILAGNSAGLADEDGDREDWLEIHNRGASTVDLGGWAVTDDPDEPGQFVLPSRLLGPGEYLVVFASGKDRRPGSGNVHTGFQLNTAGEYLGLFAPELPRRAAFEYTPAFPPQRPDFSYGLDGTGSFAYFETPTPGAPNGTSTTAEGFVPEPRFYPEHGLYSDPIAVEITTSMPAAEIYYTLDGREPTPQAGTRYTGALEVAGEPRRAVVTIRAAAYHPGFLPSEAVASTYVFADQVLAQPPDPDGFPRSWGSHPAVDYEMDPEITGDPEYREMILEGLRAVPSLSIVMDPGDMFGPGGIYSNPSGEGVQWERPASVELLHPDGREGFQVNCGVRIQGGASRNTSKSPKHSLRFLFKGAYGPAKLRYRFFPDSRMDQFDTITLRANFNNSWIHWDSGQRARAQFIRDQFPRDTLRDMGQLAPHGTFMHVYVNGLYWGLYNPVERPSAPFAASYLGGEKEEYDALNSGVAVDGDTSAWRTMLGIAAAGLSSPSQYAQIQEILDVPGLVDYLLVNFYGANADWPHHNWYAARRRQEGARFRFFSWDAERILEGVGDSQVNANQGELGALYTSLRGNAEFRLLFADHVHRHLVAPGGALAPPAVRQRWLARAGEIETAIVCESARWGDYRRDVHPFSNGPYELYTFDDFWIPERTRLLDDYFPRRTQVLLGQLRAAGLYPAVEAPAFNQQGGEIEPGFAVTLSLRPGAGGTIYYTLDGTDPRVPVTAAVASGARVYVAPVVLEDRTQVKARALDGGEWSALSEATFTLPPELERLHITEIMYHPLGGSEYEYIELTNDSDITLELGGMALTNGVAFTFPPATPLGPGESLVVVSDPEAFASRYPGTPVAGAFAGNLENDGEKVTLRDARDRTVVSVDYNDAGFWPLAPDGFGYSLVLADLDADPDDPRAWRASAAPGGSPGAADPVPLHGGVVVNEVLARGEPPLEEAIELLNLTGRDISLGGWYLADSRADTAGLKKYRIPPGTVIPAGGFAVFYQEDFGAAFRLDDADGAVYLASADPLGELTGHITGHRLGGSLPNVSAGRYVTSGAVEFTVLTEPSFGAEAPASVGEFRTGGGAANSPPLVGPVVIHEIHYHPRDPDVEFLELRNLTGAAVALHDPALGRGWRLEGVRDSTGRDAFEFGPGAEIAAGGYVLVVGVLPTLFRDFYGVAASVPIHGPWGGALDNAGEEVDLEHPVAAPGGGVAYVRADRVRYNDKSPWPAAADGAGPSLERVMAAEYGNDPANWEASELPAGTPGAPNSASPPEDNLPPAARFTMSRASGDAPLLVRFDASGSSDPDGEIIHFAWSFGDGGSDTGESVTHAFLAPGVYTVTLRVTDDRSARSSALDTVTVTQPDLGGGQTPGDCNQDGALDLADAVCLLARLFRGTVPLPCGGGSANDGGNRILLDVDGSGAVNLTDAIFVLDFLYRSGSPPALGTGCVPVAGCPEVCRP